MEIVMGAKSIPSMLGIDIERAIEIVKAIDTEFSIWLANVNEPASQDWLFDASIKRVRPQNESEIFFIGYKVGRLVERASKPY